MWLLKPAILVLANDKQGTNSWLLCRYRMTIWTAMATQRSSARLGQTFR